MGVVGAVFLLLLGLCVGSFLNVVIYRVPRDLSVVSPGSACPSCKNPVRGFDNVPVLSWVVLGGKCRDCRTPISARYPAIELLTGLLFLAVGLRLDGEDAVLAAWLVVAAAGVALTAIDLELYRLPFKVTIPATVMTVAALAVDGVLESFDPAPKALASAAVWFGLYWLLWFGSAGRAMGFGDVVLAPLLGVALGWLGWGPSLVGLLGGFVVGAAIGGGLMVFGKAGRKTKVPHGPFMIAGAALGLFVGQEIWDWYLGTLGR
jgi:leader peptidase (prepilin peptidase) / N-methyltransferase